MLKCEICHKESTSLSVYGRMFSMAVCEECESKMQPHETQFNQLFIKFNDGNLEYQMTITKDAVYTYPKDSQKVVIVMEGGLVSNVHVSKDFGENVDVVILDHDIMDGYSPDNDELEEYYIKALSIDQDDTIRSIY